MRKRRTTWHAAARAAGHESTLRELRIWTRQKLVWTEPVRTDASVDGRSAVAARPDWTAPVNDSKAA